MQKDAASVRSIRFQLEKPTTIVALMDGNQRFHQECIQECIVLLEILWQALKAQIGLPSIDHFLKRKDASREVRRDRHTLAYCPCYLIVL